MIFVLPTPNGGLKVNGGEEEVGWKFRSGVKGKCAIKVGHRQQSWTDIILNRLKA